MRTWFSLILALLILFVAFIAGPEHPTAQAQTDAPLIMLLNGDLWSWSPGSGILKQLTTWGYNERPVLSPDGGRVAYNSWAQITVDAIATGQPVTGFLPSNIWVMDTRTGEAARLADQPQNAAFMVPGMSDVAVMRGTPSWALNAERIAWSEYASPENVYRLVSYNFATASVQVIVPNLPIPFADAGNIPLHEVKWGYTAIGVLNGAFNPATSDFEQTLYVYDPDTGALVSQAVVGSASTELVYDFVWLMDSGVEYIAVMYPSGRGQLLDARAGTLQDLPTWPEMYSASTSNLNAITATIEPTTDTGGSLRPTLLVVHPDRQQTSRFDLNGGPESVAISPDGQIIAYVTEAVILWQNGQTTPIVGTEGIPIPGGNVALVWGPVWWRLRVELAAVPATGVEVSGGVGGAATGWRVCSPLPRLVIGGQGRVTPGLPNLLRSLPRRGPDSIVLGRIPGGGVFTVLSGPQCDLEGRFWWQVNYNGLVGWTPEGQGYLYWTEPFSGVPTVCSPPPRLTIGSTAYVTPGLPNLIRSLPRSGPDSIILGRIPGGGYFTVLSGPQCDSVGRYWWQVNYNGVVGWTPEGQGTTYYVTPFGCGNSPAPRLAPGLLGAVTPGDPNTLRTAPGAGNPSVGQVPGGGVFTVLSGPLCGPEGWTWWRVNYNGLVGWTPEGQGNTYWLVPYVAGPPPVTPIPMTPIGGCPMFTRLTIGGLGRVTPGDPNTVRSVPGIGNGQVLGQIPADGVFTVLNGPQCAADGIYWWQVNYNGLVGWTGEGRNGVYWLEPVFDSGPIEVIPGEIIITPGEIIVTPGEIIIIPGEDIIVNPPIDLTPQPTLCPLPTRLVVGGLGVVTPGAPNVIRNLPGRSNGDVIGEIPAGGVFSVLSGPQCTAEGINWWEVSYNGTLGWTGEGENGTYWVAPAG